MKFISLFKVRDMSAAIQHYTQVLDFVLTDPEDTEHSPVVDLGHPEIELQLTTAEDNQLFGSVVYVWVDDVDSLFSKFVSRGLNTSDYPDSPVHQQPVNQSWGRREFYVTDDDGNTLRFCQSNY